MQTTKTARTATPELVAKLNPARFPGMSGKMAAIVGFVLGETFSDPAIAEMCVTSDGFVLARSEGDVGMNDFIGDVRDMNQNWSHLVSLAGLTDDEQQLAAELYHQGRIERW